MRLEIVVLGLTSLTGCTLWTEHSVAPGDAGASDDGASGQSATCAEEAAQASALLQSKASDFASLACATDSDCTLGLGPASCMSPGCGGTLVTTSNAGAWNALVSQANSTICTAACTQPPFPCALPATGGPACVNGTCQAQFPVSAWTSLIVEQGAADPSSACSSTKSCTSWSVTSNGSVQSVGAAGTASATLSSADLATLNGILESVSFRSGPPSCPDADAGAEDGGVESTGMSVQRPDFSVYSVDITGCVQSAGASDVKTVFELLQAYPP